MPNTTNLLSEILTGLDNQSDIKAYFKEPERAYVFYIFSNAVAVEYFLSTFTQITGKAPTSHKGEVNYVACEFDSKQKAIDFRNKFDSVIFKIKATDTILTMDNSSEWFKNTVLAETSDLLPVSTFVASSTELDSSHVEKIKNSFVIQQRDLNSMKVLTKKNPSFDRTVEFIKDVLVSKGMFLSPRDCDTVIDYCISLFKDIPYLTGGLDEFISSKLTKYICNKKMELAESSMSQREIVHDDGFRPLISYNADYSSLEMTKEQRSVLYEKKIPKKVESILSNVKMTDQQWHSICLELQSHLIGNCLDNCFTEYNSLYDKDYSVRQILQLAYQTYNTQLLYNSLNNISNSLNEMSMIETVEKLNQLIRKN